MATELDKIGQQATALWKNMPPKKRVLAIAVVAAAAVGIAFVTMSAPEEKYALLYAGLSADDAAKVLEQLKAQNTTYKLTNNGASIEVPEARVHELRITLAASGLPRGGSVGFEVFDKQNFGTTSFVEQMNYRRALGGELARTIMSIEAVEQARVHLAIKERSLYKHQDEPPSASVVIKLRMGHELAPAQVKGIVHLVASSVEGLKRERVTVVDDRGTVLWSDDDLAVESDAQRQLERTLARRISDITDRIVGPGNSVVIVTAEIDSSFKETTEEIYDRDRTALRSETKSQEKNESAALLPSGIAGARGNLPGAGDPTVASSTSPQSMRSAETRNFEVNRVMNRIIGPKSHVKRIHVAVLVNGASGETIANALTATVTDGIRFKSADLESIALLAKEAAGLDPARGDRLEVRSVPFAAPPVELAAGQAEVAKTPLLGEREMLIAAIAGAVFLCGVVLVVVIAVRKRRRKRAEEKDLDEAAKDGADSIDSLPALPIAAAKMEEALLAQEAALPRVLTARDRAIEAARNDSARAARVLAAWLAEDANKQVVQSSQKEGSPAK